MHKPKEEADWKELLAAQAASGDGNAAQMLSGHYSTGDYNPRLARYWAGVGTANGNPICMYNLGMLTLQGLGGPQDELLGVSLIKTAAAKGVITSQELEALIGHVKIEAQRN
jgi:TPR repeat protein